MTTSNIKTGDIISVRTNFVWYKLGGYIGLIIRKFTKSPWGHSAIAIWVWGELYVAEAEPKEVQITLWKEWTRDKTIRIDSPVDPVIEKDIASVIMSKQGVTGYYFAATCFYQVIYILTGMWVGHTGKAALSTGRMYCSEYVSWVYNAVLGYFGNWYELSPQGVLNSMREAFGTVYQGRASEVVISEKQAGQDNCNL